MYSLVPPSAHCAFHVLLKYDQPASQTLAARASHSPEQPQTHHVAENDLERPGLCLFLSCAGITGMSDQTQCTYARERFNSGCPACQTSPLQLSCTSDGHLFLFVDIPPQPFNAFHCLRLSLPTNPDTSLFILWPLPFILLSHFLQVEGSLTHLTFPRTIQFCSS